MNVAVDTDPCQEQPLTLREYIEQSFIYWIKKGTAQSRPVVTSFSEILLEHLEDLFPILSRCVPSGEFPFFGAGNVMAALQFSHTKMQRDISGFLGLSDNQIWWQILQDTLADPLTREIFEEVVWRAPMVIKPPRGIPLQHILRYRFGAYPIRGIDLGAAFNTALSQLNSSLYLDTSFPGYDQITQPDMRVNVVMGLGVDKVDRASALDWARASLWPFLTRPQSIATLERLYAAVLLQNDQFPFLVADVTDPERLIRSVHENVGIIGFDFVVSSYMQHQLSREFRDIHGFQDLVAALLNEGGIWIDIGEELIDNRESKDSAVRVYMKINGRLELVGIPFVLERQTMIRTVDLAYFGLD